MIVQRITRFVENPAADDFEQIAKLAFRYQFERSAALRRLCAESAVDPATLRHWSEIPPVPTAAFKSLQLHTDPPKEVFRSSGTTRGTVRSVHYHPFPELYRAIVDASFPAACLPGSAPLPALSLIPSRRDLPDSSLSFMIDHVLRCHAGPGSSTCFDERGVSVAAAIAWLERHTESGAPFLILTTALGLLELLDALEADGRRLLAPTGSRLFETGGFKGRRRQIERQELLSRLEHHLGIPSRAVVREYGMTELTSQAYTRVLEGGDPELFFTPTWLQVRILDPATLTDCRPGEPGLLALFDLGNVGSALAVLTEDLGRLDPSSGGFYLLGRADGAELRGCSLVVDDLLPT